MYNNNNNNNNEKRMKNNIYIFRTMNMYYMGNFNFLFLFQNVQSAITFKYTDINEKGSIYNKRIINVYYYHEDDIEI